MTSPYFENLNINYTNYESAIFRLAIFEYQEVPHKHTHTHSRNSKSGTLKCVLNLEEPRYRDNHVHITPADNCLSNAPGRGTGLEGLLTSEMELNYHSMIPGVSEKFGIDKSS